MLFTEVPNKEELCGLIVSELREEFGLIGVKYRKEKKHKNTAVTFLLNFHRIFKKINQISLLGQHNQEENLLNSSIPTGVDQCSFVEWSSDPSSCLCVRRLRKDS